MRWRRSTLRKQMILEAPQSNKNDTTRCLAPTHFLMEEPPWGIPKKWEIWLRIHKLSIKNSSAIAKVDIHGCMSAQNGDLYVELGLNVILMTTWVL